MLKERRKNSFNNEIIKKENNYNDIQEKSSYILPINKYNKNTNDFQNDYTDFYNKNNNNHINYNIRTENNFNDLNYNNNEFNLQNKDQINNNENCPSLNELINYKNYSIGKQGEKEEEENNNQNKEYLFDLGPNRNNRFKNQKHILEDFNFNSFNNKYNDYMDYKKNAINNNNSINGYNNIAMNRSFSSFYPKKPINNYINNSQDSFRSMNYITNSNPNLFVNDNMI